MHSEHLQRKREIAPAHEQKMEDFKNIFFALLFKSVYGRMNKRNKIFPIMIQYEINIFQVSKGT